MNDVERLRPILRAAAESGDVVDVARALRANLQPGQATQAALALRHEFGLTISEALAVAAWAEGYGDDEHIRADLRSRVKTPLKVREAQGDSFAATEAPPSSDQPTGG